MRLGSPERGGDIATLPIMVFMARGGGGDVGAQAAPCRVGVGDSHDGGRIGGRESPAMPGNLLVRDGELEKWVDDPFPQRELLGPTRPRLRVPPQHLDARGYLLCGRRGGRRSDEPSGEVIGIRELHDTVDATLRGVHLRLEPHLLDVHASGDQPLSPARLMFGRWMRWQRPALGQHAAQCFHELVARVPPAHAGTERQVIDGRARRS